MALYTYRNGVVTAAISLSLLAVAAPAVADVITGTPVRDRLFGTSGADHIDGRAGNDLIRAEAGSDEVFGRAGVDWLESQRGPDIIHGGARFDVLFAGAGDDELYGGSGGDGMRGHTGDDYLVGGAGPDFIRLGKDDDTARGGLGRDQFRVGRGEDRVHGGPGRDRISARIDGSPDFIFCGAPIGRSEGRWDVVTYLTRSGHTDPDDVFRGCEEIRIYDPSSPDRGIARLGEAEGFRFDTRPSVHRRLAVSAGG